MEANKKVKNRIAQIRREMQQVFEVLSALNLDTIEGGVTINPLSRLLPVQLLLKELMYYVRFAKTVVICDDSAMTFVLVSSCTAIGFFFLFFPVGFIFRWICRIFVWVFMGPWMKLAARRGSPQQVQRVMEELKAREHKRLIQARIKNEEAMKLKATRIMRFGRFAIRVPSANIIRFRDLPLPESYSEQKLPEYHEDTFSSKYSIISTQSVTHYVPGQKHYGVMIPALRSSNTNQLRKFTKDKKNQIQRHQSPPINDLYLSNDYTYSSRCSKVLSPKEMFDLETSRGCKQPLLEVIETNEKDEEGFELVPLYNWSVTSASRDNMKRIESKKPNITDEEASIEELVSASETNETRIIENVLSDLTLN